jgi:hypothetical protein
MRERLPRHLDATVYPIQFNGYAHFFDDPHAANGGFKRNRT